jgi:glutathione S-transferase
VEGGARAGGDAEAGHRRAHGRLPQDSYLADCLKPTPTLFPSPLAEALAEWADSALFEVAVPVAMRPTKFDEVLRLLTPDELAKMGEDRAAMREGARKKPMPFAAARAHLRVYLERLDRALATTPFLLGEAPSIADFSAYHSTWFLEKIAPEPLAPHANLRAWMVRIAAMPSAVVTPITSDDALGICGDGPNEFRTEVPFEDENGLTLGQRVVVRAGDYGRDPVEGDLVLATTNEIAVRREDPRAGTVFVHFPRVGYDLTPPRSE